MAVMNPFFEPELLKRLQNGDESAFDHFYVVYSASIYRRLLKMVKVEVVAQELLQDVFVKIWEKRLMIDPEQSFRSFLFRIAENMVFDFYRKLSRDERLRDEVIRVSATCSMDTEEAVSAKETTYYLNRAIERLPRKQKQIFILCKMEGRSYEEVARALGISTSTVNGHIVNATKLIRKSLLKYEVMLVSILSSLSFFQQ